MDPLEILAGMVVLFFVGAIFYLLYRWEKDGVWKGVVATRKNRHMLAIVSGIALFGGFAGMILMMTAGTQIPLLMMTFIVCISLGLYFFFVALFYKSTEKRSVA